jgi:hypothetical protein
MSMSFSECYACKAIVLPTDEACLGCGASQSEAAASAHRDDSAGRAMRERWQGLLIIGTVVAFCLGGGIGFYLGQVDNPGLRPRWESQVSVKETLAEDEIHRTFIRLLNENEELPMRIVNWARGGNGELILEIATPDPSDHPTLLWEALNTEQRSGLVGLISIGHARSMEAGGRRTNHAKDGFTVIAVRYAGTREPLAVRARNGQIYIYPSPYADLAGAASAPSVSR